MIVIDPVVWGSEVLYTLPAKSAAEKESLSEAKELFVEMEVRKMEIDDLGTVFHLGERLFTPEKYPNLYRVWDEFEVTGLFHSEPELCLVADIDGKTEGFLMGSTVEKAGTAWNYGHIFWLGVAQKYQRKGVAGRLYSAFRKLMITRGVRILVVDTQADNINAVEFFRRQGFSQETEHIYMANNLENETRQSTVQAKS